MSTITDIQQEHVDKLLEAALSPKETLLGVQTIFGEVQFLYPNMFNRFVQKFWTKFSRRSNFS